MRITSDLNATLSNDRQMIEFVTDGGVAVLNFGGLKVFDANGRSLSTWFELNASRLCILVDDTDAAYPITIDSLATSPDWTAQGNQADAALGFSVATAGDVNNDGFSDVIIGAYLYDNGLQDEGKAFVYHGSASGLSGMPSWTERGNQASVATAGDVNVDGYSDVIIGAPQYSNGQANEGVAFVFHGSQNGLSMGAADWTAEADYPGRNLGMSVATVGDVNGNGCSDVIITSGQGSNDEAFVWYGSPAPVGLGPNGTPSNRDWRVGPLEPGISVGLAGDVNGDGYSDVIVGAPQYEDAQQDEGWALVWYGSLGGLGFDGTVANADWYYESNLANTQFGNAVGTAGDVNGDGYADIIVGAYGHDGAASNAGAVYVFYGSPNGPSVIADWTVQGSQADDYFGQSVATVGDVNGDGYADVIVGGAKFNPSPLCPVEKLIGRPMGRV